MEIKKAASAGSLESNDLMVSVAPGSSGREIAIKSIVAAQFYDSIQSDVKNVLDFLGVQNVRMEINDMGALSYVVRSRVETALKRGGEALC